MSDKLLEDCGGPYDMDPSHTITCWEAEPLSPAEATLLSYLLENPKLVSGKRMFHVGIGNSELPVALSDHLREYLGITISQPELDRFDQDLADKPHMRGLLINKYDPRQYELIDGSFDIILDTLLKSVTCCEKHFDEMITFFVSKLAAGGSILTTKNGINFGWTGTRLRAFTPGSQSDPTIQQDRVLGESGLADLADRHGLVIVTGPMGATGDIVLSLRKA